MKLIDIQNYLEKKFNLGAWARKDSSMNGVQVGNWQQDIQKVALGVDACYQTFVEAKQRGADLLFVHHGLFWGKPLALTGPHYKRVQFLLEHNLALAAIHLPLDAHPQLGNNAGMAKILELEDTLPFGEYKGDLIGVKGKLPTAHSLDQIIEKLFGSKDHILKALPFGKKEILTLGIVSGGAPYEVQDAIDQNLDLYITGDAQHIVYHTALEAKINIIFGGHYSTETHGVKLLGRALEEELGLETFFVHQPTGL